MWKKNAKISPTIGLLTQFQVVFWSETIFPSLYLYSHDWSARVLFLGVLYWVQMTFMNFDMKKILSFFFRLCIKIILAGLLSPFDFRDTINHIWAMSEQFFNFLHWVELVPIRSFMKIFFLNFLEIN